MQREEPRLVELQLRVGEPEGDRLELVDPPTERLAALRVVDRVLERGPPDAEGAGRELHARDVEDVHQPAEALPLAAEPALVRDEALLEEELAGGEAAAAHLRQPRADHEAGIAALDDERGDPLRSRSRLDRREDDAEIRDRRVPDELLPPVDHVAPVDPPGARLDRGRVGAVLGLGDRNGTGRWVGAAERRQVALLLLVRSEREQRPREEAALGDHPEDRRVAERELLDHRAAVGQALDPTAAERDRQVVAGEPELGGAAQLGERVLLRLVVAQCDGTQLVSRELPRPREQRR